MRRITSLRRYDQVGMSLIELMVAVVLGLIVVSGLIQVLIANRSAYQVQQGTNFQQQNLRFANDSLSWSLRLADFWGGVNVKDIQGKLGPGSGAATTNCDDTWARAAQNNAVGSGAVYGYDGASSFPLNNCVSKGNYVPGSDVLVVRYVDTDPCGVLTTDSNLVTTNCTPTSPYYLAAYPGVWANMFAGTSVPAMPPSSQSNMQRYVYPYRVEMYYLQPCSNPPAGGTCDATSDGGNPQPTLMRMQYKNDGTTTLVSDPVVSGIEQMQLEYGVVTNAGADPNTAISITQYKSATNMTVADWQNAMAVRVTLVARGSDRDISVDHSGTFNLTAGCSYTLSNTGAFTLGVGADCTGFSLANLSRPDQFVRNLFQQTVQLRNRSRGE